jgi:hypothetical protein
MSTVRQAAETLRARGIRCRRDPIAAGGWLAEIGNIQYCIGGLTLIAAAASSDPVETLDLSCR